MKTLNVLKGIINRVKKKKCYNTKKCYEENGNKDGTCYGLVGGDKFTEYVQYGCINCKYWRYLPKIRQIKPYEIKIVITSMSELPEYCYDCPCYDGVNDKCKADTEGRTSMYRPFWCPLKEEKNRATVHRGE